MLWAGAMIENPLVAQVSRRSAILGGGAALALASMPARALAAATPALPTPLLRRAMAAFQTHAGRLAHRDMLGVVDFSLPSRAPRFFLVDPASGRSKALLVAHGRGSDPDHSGWVERFSNRPGSAASSPGSYVTAETYVGQHGLSRRLVGLDAENSNARSRAIVVHSAWYVSDAMVAAHGKLGRSEGCLAVDAADLPYVLDRLGAGRLIYAGKV